MKDVDANQRTDASNSPTVSVNDPSFSNLWGVRRIKADQVWDNLSGQETDAVVVGVIDTGVDYEHEDLADNMWKNPLEIEGNGIDDDNNGYVDDIYGWDFGNQDNDPIDVHSHGTHVAGTIAATGNNGIGVVGVNPYAEILALKIFDDRGRGYTDDAIASVRYAIKLKEAYDQDPATGANIRVLNMSFGGGEATSEFEAVIEDAGEVGILVVAAAGNNNRNIDKQSFYPASYSNDNLIAVAATQQNNNRSSYSNYGATTVDVAAPGDNIYSTLPNNKYGNKQGTSMAAPHVAGAASLLFAYDPSLTPSEVKQILIDSSVEVEDFKGKVVSNGRINLKRAFELIVDSNENPMAENDNFNTEENSILTFTVNDLLGNDSDPEDTPLTMDSMDLANLQGELTEDVDGNYIYDSKGQFDYLQVGETGTDSFTYTIKDEQDAVSNSATVTITIEGVNDAPTGINLDNNTIDENSSNDTVIGMFSTIDIDTTDNHTYTLLDDADGRFKLVDNQLQVADGTLLDYEANTHHQITIQTTDSGGLTYDEVFTINVNDLSDTASSYFDMTVDGDTVSYQANEIHSYGGRKQDQKGTVTFADTDTITLMGNTWKAVDLTSYVITPNTILTFDFQSSQEGEVHGIGFDNDKKISGDTTFQLFGSQKWGKQKYNNYSIEPNSEPEWKSYTISVGKHFTGSFRYLTFANDDDRSFQEISDYGNSSFRNIQLFNLITGTDGDDLLTGTSSKDYFRFNSLTGLDTVTNFDASQGDKIQIDTSVYGLETGDYTQVGFNDTTHTLSYNSYDLAVLEGITNADFSGIDDVVFI
ncbi:MAG: S8 family serine peptidase [Microcystaceae cyanobacterium]